MEDQLAINIFLKNQMNKTKLVSHLEGGGGNWLRGRGREKRREKEEEEEGREEKKYGFLWISLDTCIDFYGFV